MQDKKIFLAGGVLFLLVAAANFFILREPSKESPSVPPSENLKLSGNMPSGPIQRGNMPPDHDQKIEIGRLRERLKTNPTDADHWIQLGNLLFDGGQFDQAVEPYRTALSLRPDNNDVRTDYAVCFFNTGQLNEAATELERVLRSDPNHVTALYNLGVVYSHMNQVDKARIYWNRVVQTAPGSDFARKASEALGKL